MKYLFELGRQPEISTAELKAVFSHKNIELKNPITKSHFLTAEIDEDIDTKHIAKNLGGTMKIGQAIKNVGDPIKSIVHFLHENNSGKIHFAVSGEVTKKTGIAIKKQLKSLGRSVRFVETKNTASILHNNLVEKKSDFTVLENEIFVTEAIQDIEGFTKRDFGRPGSDDKSGMLPPKLARIMINLSEIKPTDTLLDPFCGSGTVLTEALSLGFENILGSDISQKAIDDTKQNVEWLNKKFDLTPKTFDLYTSDAGKLSTHIKPNTVHAIVSEPYMGKPLRGNENKETLKKQAKELGQLYIESFTAFHKILKKDGVAIFIIPKFRHEDKWISIDCLDEIKKIGFEILPLAPRPEKREMKGVDSLTYWRTKQYVGRERWKFKKR
ncbi:hypothetical protein C0581_04175 [Candidatus Parcubacteria bacterium]|nr:MAG: hypothetical protein C0581_04175 [Candidatus Parcubacteria bacterium]